MSGMLYVLAYPEFDQSTAERIARFRSLHEPERARLVAPHVTLVFGVQHVARASFLEQFLRIASRSHAIPVSFPRTDVVHDPFEATHKLFLICEDGRDSLTALHHALYEGPHRAEFDTSIPFRPHMTLATCSDPAQVLQLDTDAIGPLPITGVIRSLAVVERLGHRLQTHHEVALSV